MKRVRCISRKVNGMTEVALPHLFLGVFADGEERDLDDEVADKLLKGSLCFEEAVPVVKPQEKPAAFSADAQPDGGKL